jgi:hypothetical protein
MDPMDRFDLFAARCEELASTRLIRDYGLRSTLSLKYRMHVGFSMETSHVDEDDLPSVSTLGEAG